MRIAAPAKINLHLRVGPPRADGFHPLLTWMTTIGLHDTITLQPLTLESGPRPLPAHAGDPCQDKPLGNVENGDTAHVSAKPADAKMSSLPISGVADPGAVGGGIRLSCSDPTLPTDERNLVFKAAKLLGGNPQLPVSIHLEKQIPHGGGLGGGSSDAAFTLAALNQFWHLKKSTAELSELAAKLGSDIPFFLHGPSSVCRGRGEEIQPVAPPGVARWVLLMLPDLSMPTPAVYKQFDAMKLGRISDIETEPDWNQWAALSSHNLLRRLINDLEPAAFAIEPRLATLRTDLERKLSRPVRMSGSGSSLFTLYDERGEAAKSAELANRNSGVRAIEVELTPMAVGLYDD